LPRFSIITDWNWEEVVNGKGGEALLNFESELVEEEV
jgi:hypothetical protein